MVVNPSLFLDPSFGVGQKTDPFPFLSPPFPFPYLFLPCHSAKDVGANHPGDYSNFPDLHSKESGDFWAVDPPPLHCLLGVTGLLRPLLPVGLGVSGLDTLDGLGETLRGLPGTDAGGEEGGGKRGRTTFVPPLLATPSLASWSAMRTYLGSRVGDRYRS